ncbi:hypothetical protein [Paenibacillus apiarius]|uniref:hypothetical protein n=1 Tax=Paenibacillus apiarius TaxID=46240 RepID=UPI003B3A05A8
MSVNRYMHIVRSGTHVPMGKAYRFFIIVMYHADSMGLNVIEKSADSLSKSALTLSFIPADGIEVRAIYGYESAVQGDRRLIVLGPPVPDDMKLLVIECESSGSWDIPGKWTIAQCELMLEGKGQREEAQTVIEVQQIQMDVTESDSLCAAEHQVNRQLKWIRELPLLTPSLHASRMTENKQDPYWLFQRKLDELIVVAIQAPQDELRQMLLYIHEKLVQYGERLILRK